MSSRALGAQFSGSPEVPSHIMEQWGQSVGMVPTSALSRLSFQRLRYDPSQLVDSLREEGVREVLHVKYDPKTHRAALGEGNHRVAAALQAGISHLPVVVHRWSIDDDLPGRTMTESKDFPREPDGYVKGQFHPRHIGLV